eukprot:14451871-Alexandrium_andersonii.AAC.1
MELVDGGCEVAENDELKAKQNEPKGEVNTARVRGGELFGFMKCEGDNAYSIMKLRMLERDVHGYLEAEQNMADRTETMQLVKAQP